MSADKLPVIPEQQWLTDADRIRMAMDEEGIKAFLMSDGVGLFMIEAIRGTERYAHVDGYVSYVTNVGEVAYSAEADIKFLRNGRVAKWIRERLRLPERAYVSATIFTSESRDLEP